MRLAPGCPRCPASVEGSGADWSCPLHGDIVPLWRVVEPTYDAFAEHLQMSRPLPSLLPWPLPADWQVSDFGCVVAEGEPAQAAFVSCSGASDLDGAVEVTVVTEEPGVGLAARCGGAIHTDPGREAGVGTPPTRVRLDGTTVPLWVVSATEGGDALDRTVLAGESHGRWLWVVLRPASAALLLSELGPLVDVSALGPELVATPFGSVPRSW